MTSTRAMSFLGELTEIAQVATDFRALQVATLERLRSLVGCETVLWGDNRPGNPAFLAADDRARGALQRFTACPARYDVPERHPLIRRSGGVAVDREFFSSTERDRLPLYSEILRPAGIQTYLACELTFRGSVMSFITMSRHERRPAIGQREKDVMRSLLGPLALVQAAYRSSGSAPRRAEVLDALSRREAQVAALIARGLQNKEIAALLGTSPETVRKQTIRIYKKLGISGRVELALQFVDTQSSSVALRT